VEEISRDGCGEDIEGGGVECLAGSVGCGGMVLVVDLVWLVWGERGKK